MSKHAPPALIIIASENTDAAAALAFGLADHFDRFMNRLTERFALRDHRTPVIDGYVLDELGLYHALKVALEQTVAIVAVRPGAVEWREVLRELSPHCTPAIAQIMLTDGEFNSRLSHDDHIADTLVLPHGETLEAQMKFSLIYLRHRRGEIARDPAALYRLPERPRLIKRDDFIPG